MLIDQREEKDRPWLARIPSTLATCERQWGLQIGPRFPTQSPHYVAPAVRADSEALVVKVCAPTGEFLQEAEALRLFAGRGMVQLLSCDPSNEVLLLERLQPGTSLSCVADNEQATSIAATVMRQLWRPVPRGHPFPSVSDWGAVFAHVRRHYGGGSGPFPPALLEEAETLFTELSTSMAEPVLLHGDLHHDNILTAEREPWLAIDPKGLIGEPAYEVGEVVRSALPEYLSSYQIARLLARRVDQLAQELQVDRARVRGWGLVQAVLSEWWCLEDGGSLCDPALTEATLLTAIKV
jgi:streptomycin 6-kinase